MAGEGHPVESIDRALRLLGELAEAGPGGASLAHLAQSLKLNKATIHRALATLKNRAFVAQDPSSGDYMLGPAALLLGDRFYSTENLSALVHPALVTLSREITELVHLGVLSGSNVLYIDKVEPDRPIRVWSAIGREFPALTTALGRSLLAFRGTSRSQLGAYAVPGLDPESYWSVIERTREQGFSSEFEENEAGVACIGVPLLRGQTAVAAISVTAPIERMTRHRVSTILRTVQGVLPNALPDGFAIPDFATAEWGELR